MLPLWSVPGEQHALAPHDRLDACEVGRPGVHEVGESQLLGHGAWACWARGGRARGGWATAITAMCWDMCLRFYSRAAVAKLGAGGRKAWS